MFNIKTSKRIYTFKAAGESKINVMIKTPHLNVIGGKLLRNIDDYVIMTSILPAIQATLGPTLNRRWYVNS